MVYNRRYKYTRRSRRVLKTGAGNDERRDGLAREFRKNKRRGVHCGVVVPKRFELGTLCARSREETRVVRVRAASVGGEEIGSRRGMKSRRASSEAFAKINVVREVGYSQTLSYFSSSSDARGPSVWAFRNEWQTRKRREATRRNAKRRARARDSERKR